MRKEEFFGCECLGPEHTLRFVWWDDDDDPDKKIYVTTFLSEFSFWKRLWHGIKYICGYKCKFGHFEEYIFNEDHAKKLVSVLTEQFNLDSQNSLDVQ